VVVVAFAGGLVGLFSLETKSAVVDNERVVTGDH